LREQDLQGIPIVVGITGHRDLRQEDIPILKKQVREELEMLQNKYLNSNIRMLNSMAAGADILCAQVAETLGIPIVCPLPMELEEYEKDFSMEDLSELRRLLAYAETIFVTSHIEDERPERDFLYRQAGIYIATHCHVLIALWDGESAVEDGCGTANVVEFMYEGNYQGNELLRSPNEGAVIHIPTPRKGCLLPYKGNAILLEHIHGGLEELLSQTDQFNKDAREIRIKDSYSLLPEECMNQAGRRKIQKVYDTADQMAICWQKRYLSIMKLLAIFSVGLVLLYLLYDEAEMNICIVGFGIVTILYAISTVIIHKQNQHGKYLHYRLLAETCRIQLYLNSIGGKRNISSAFTWTQKKEATWVRKAIDTLMIGLEGDDPISMDLLKNAWIEEQLNYHQSAKKRDEKNNNVGEYVTRGMMICTLIMWAFVLVLEYQFNSIMLINIIGLTIRTWMKILWGCASAVTLFISSYYGKLSLERKCIDHTKMAELFAIASKQYELFPNRREELFYNLAREELIENGNWVSYCQENRPDFSL